MITNGIYFINLGKYEPTPTVLHEVSVPIISNEKCYEWFSEAGYSKPVPKTMMCAGFKDGGKDSCQVIIYCTHATITPHKRTQSLMN